MKKPPFGAGQTIECSISGLDHEGYGLSVVDGVPLRIRGALPDELVRARINYVGRRETFAEAVKVLRRSPVRLVKPVCDKWTTCDGCPFVLMGYQAQLNWKRVLVESFINSYKSLRTVTVHPVIPSDKPLGYRNSAKLVAGGKFADPIIGMYRSNTHQVTDASDCPLHHPLINRVVQVVKEGIRKGKVPVYSQRTGSGILRYLVVRVSESAGAAMVVFVTARRSFNEIHHLSKYLQSRVPEVTVVAQNVNSSAGNVILGQHDYFVTKEQSLCDTVGNIRFHISPRSFFQINNGGARSIYEKVLDWSALTGGETVVDVYCGVGGISLYLARGAKEVIGYESVDDAVADAEKNARLNGIGNCRFEAGDAAELLHGLREEGGKADLVVLNPPRKGCEEKVLKNAAALGPRKIIYVSCSPETLARDLDILAGLGYGTLEIQPVDMFPQTPHVENVALLSRKA
ncbi:MAG TPA: 23S rRNA (uracil(1939)-C(5))-methyltransferase RlmD [Geobacteraceae bacterium]|nr:23S rRNA (uracil(1939)-C(5))-methyltransferase RlmD [Geobacteraceae bacterium]